MTLGRLLALRLPGLPDMQIEDIVLGVIVSKVEGDRANSDVHVVHERRSSE